MRWWHVPTLIVAAGASLLALMFANACADPVVRQGQVVVRGGPSGAPPIRVLVWSDLHLGNLVTDRSRLAALVASANMLRPDLVLLAGDFIAGHERRDAAVAPDLAPLRMLSARLGSVAVLGHDH